MVPPAGVLVSAVTPFDQRGRVDATALRDLVAFLTSMDLQGLFALGTAAEALLMSRQERMDAAEIIAESSEGSGSLPVVLHVGAADSGSTAALGAHAETIGVRSLAAVAPYYYSHSTQDLVCHFGALAESAPESDLFVYENPARAGYEIGPTTFVLLREAVPSIVGVKDTGDSLGRVGRYLVLDDAPTVYTGNNDLIYPSLSLGASGAVSALASVVPELVGSIHRNWLSGHTSEAIGDQRSLTKLVSSIARFPYLASIKAIGQMRGLPTGHLRGPHTPLSESEVAELSSHLHRSEELADWLGPL